MNTENDWSTAAPQVIYEGYPDHDLLPIEPPRPEEKIGDFTSRAENAADTLFLCREADDEIDAREYLARLDRAIRDIEYVRDAFRDHAGTSSTVSQKARNDVTIRLSLDRDWIELALSYADAKGRRSGSVSSSLHSAEENDDEFNAAMDAVESMVLAHACAGIDVTDPRYVEGVRTCVDSCGNNL